MFAFNLINKQLNSFVMLLIIVIFSEVCTSMAVVRLMKKGQKSGKTAVDLMSNNDIDNHYRRAVDHHKKRGIHK